LPFLFVLAAYQYPFFAGNIRSKVPLVLYAFSIAAIAGNHVVLLGFVLAAFCFFLCDTHNFIQSDKRKIILFASFLIAFPILFMFIQSAVALSTVYTVI